MRSDDDMKWILGTRGSPLAMAQSKQVQAMLMDAYHDVEVEIKVIRTIGDKRQDLALDAFKDKGVFIKELEVELLHKRIDLAVHSMKDMPSVLHEDLTLTKTLLRADARDVVLLRDASMLRQGGSIATGSHRRAMQIKAWRKDLEVVPIRGNVETRIQHMKERKLDGIMVAAAGLQRLGLQDQITMYMDEDTITPACGQGAIAIEVCRAHPDILARVNALCDVCVDQEVQIERRLLQLVNAGCHTPFGVRAHIDHDQVELRCFYAHDEEAKQHRIHEVFPLQTCDAALTRIAQALLGKDRDML